jgi:hypothetical protein
VFGSQLSFQGLPDVREATKERWHEQDAAAGEVQKNRTFLRGKSTAFYEQKPNVPVIAAQKYGVRWRTDDLKTRVLRFHFRHEKGPQPKKGTRHQLSDLWCRTGGEVSAYQRPTTHGTTSRSPTTRKRLALP